LGCAERSQRLEKSRAAGWVSGSFDFSRQIKQALLFEKRSKNFLQGCRGVVGDSHEKVFGFLKKNTFLILFHVT
jgi:hypothetical protein